MEKLIYLWHRLVAPELLEKFRLARQHYNVILEAYSVQNKTHIKEMIEKNKEIAKLQYIISSDVNPCILTNRDYAAKQRIFDLEKENLNLRSTLNDLRKSQP